MKFGGRPRLEEKWRGGCVHHSATPPRGIAASHCFRVTGKQLGCYHNFAPEEEEKPAPHQRTCKILTWSSRQQAFDFLVSAFLVSQVHWEKELASLRRNSPSSEETHHIYYLLLQRLHKVSSHLLLAWATLATLQQPSKYCPRKVHTLRMRMDHSTIAKGLAEQDSLVEKGHWVRISLKAALPGSDTWQEVAARLHLYLAGSLSQRHPPDNATPSPILLLASQSCDQD